MEKKEKIKKDKVEMRSCRIIMDIKLPLEKISSKLNWRITEIQKVLTSTNCICDFINQQIFFKEGDYEE